MLQNNVRPVKVLERAFAHVCTKGADEGPEWLADQLKAVRQDLLVQGVEGAFAWSVYESNARLSLEQGDRGEFIQIVTQMRKMAHGPDASGYEQRAVMEYLAYRILFTLLQGDHSALNEELLLVTAEARQHPCIRHAMAFVRAHASHNHAVLVRLADTAPNFGGLVITLFLPSLRLSFYRAVLKAYIPGIPFDVLGQMLYYNGSGVADAASAFAMDHNGTARKEDDWKSIDCKTSLAGLERLTKQEMNPQFADLRDASAECGLKRKRAARFGPGGKIEGWA